MYGYIYKTTNLIDGKIYIGQKRSSWFKGPKYLGSGKHLKRAVQKYGEENFSVELVEEINSKEEMDSREIYWIEFFKATDPKVGYNISTGGKVNRTMIGIHNPRYGKHLTEEEKAKQRASKLKSKLEGKKPKPISKEVYKRISESLKGHAVSQECREKLSQYNKNKIYITNGIENKTILPKFLPEWEAKGFWQGRIKKKIPKKVWVNNIIEEKLILEQDVQRFIENGFSLGRILHPERVGSTFGRIWITNGKEDKSIKPEDLDTFINQGFYKGRCFKKEYKQLNNQEGTINE